MGLKAVVLSKHYKKGNPGETMGFEEAEADALIEAGAARAYDSDKAADVENKAVLDGPNKGKRTK